MSLLWQHFLLCKHTLWQYMCLTPSPPHHPTLLLTTPMVPPDHACPPATLKVSQHPSRPWNRGYGIRPNDLSYSSETPGPLSPMLFGLLWGLASNSGAQQILRRSPKGIPTT